MFDDDSRAAAPEPPLTPAWRRILLAVLLTLFAALTLALGHDVGVAVVSGAFDVPASSVSRAVRSGTPALGGIAALTIAEVVLALVVGAVIVANMGRERAGLVLGGTGAALRWTLPILAVIVVAPLALSLAAGHDPLHDDLDATRIAWLVALACAIGLAEEIAFRGGVYGVLGGRAAPALAVVGSAALFGVLHLGNGGLANPLAVTLVVGVPFALIRLAGGSVLGLAVTHAIIDTWALLQLGGVRLPDDVSVEAQVGQVGLAATICAGYLLWYLRRTGMATDRSSAGAPDG